MWSHSPKTGLTSVVKIPRWLCPLALSLIFWTPGCDQSLSRSYHADIALIMQSNCVSCHRTGGAGPFSLETYEDVKKMAAISLQAMKSGTMPPWLPDPNCREFANQRVMAENDKIIFEEWVGQDTPMGDITQTPAELKGITSALQTNDFPSTHIAKPEEVYTPKKELTDDYRCFILNQEFEEDMYMMGSHVVPLKEALVHHALIYAIRPDLKQTVLDADAAEDGPGYTCFGGPIPSGGEIAILTSVVQLGGFTPGNLPRQPSTEIGIPIRAGSLIVMQIHYNTLGGAPIEPDQTEFHMVLQKEKPPFVADTRPLPIRELDIPKGQSSVKHETALTNFRNKPFNIGGVAAHMHLLGSKFDAQIERNNGETECLISIKDYDFNWQEPFAFNQGEIAVVNPGDSIRFSCNHDNSEKNQPLANGKKIAPRDVIWGEGTYDEMCILFITSIEPTESYIPFTRQCEFASRCLENCQQADSPITCLWDCEDMDPGCALCTLDKLGTDCLAKNCLQSVINILPCWSTCGYNAIVFDGNLGTCMKEICAPEYQALGTCSNNAAVAGHCNAEFSACGIEF